MSTFCFSSWLSNGYNIHRGLRRTQSAYVNSSLQPQCSSRYRYQRLSNKTGTRLFHLTGVNEVSLQIYGYLEEINLRDKPEFHALSYTWGSAVEEEETEESLHRMKPRYDLVIHPQPCLTKQRGWRDNETDSTDIWHCDSIEYIPLQKTLSDFLRRHFDTITGAYRPLPLWVDAICINQDDEDERTSQILLMGEIYSIAHQVIVWLGDYEEDLECFKWFHETVLSAILRFKDNFDTVTMEIKQPG